MNKIISVLILSCISSFGQERSGIDLNPDPPSTMYAPVKSLSMIRVPDGFKLELVAAEPMIEEPVCMAWGPDGELYVAEMRSYMQDIDMSGELEPISRVVKLVGKEQAGIIRHEPGDSIQIGADQIQPVGNYNPPNHFSGTIENLTFKYPNGQ